MFVWCSRLLKRKELWVLKELIIVIWVYKSWFLRCVVIFVGYRVSGRNGRVVEGGL